jgi:antitoxin ParD1/3/4
MPSPDKRTISLPTEQGNYIDSQVASGAYATASEVVRAGLRALQERDAAIERWLRSEVVPVAVSMQADPARSVSAAHVFADLRAELKDRLR